MDRERVSERLNHIREAIRGIQDTVAGLQRNTVIEHWTLRSAVERGLEIISEASRHLPEDLLQRYPNIPWHNIRGIGNFLRHAYSNIEPDILWEIVTDHLDPLDKAVQAMQKAIGEIR